MVQLGLILFKCYGLNKSTNQYNYTLFCPFRARTHAFTQIKLTHCMNICFCVCIFVLLYRHLLCYFQPCIVRDVYIYIYISVHHFRIFNSLSSGTHYSWNLLEIVVLMLQTCQKCIMNERQTDIQTARQQDRKRVWELVDKGMKAKMDGSSML